MYICKNQWHNLNQWHNCKNQWHNLNRCSTIQWYSWDICKNQWHNLNILKNRCSTIQRCHAIVVLLGWPLSSTERIHK